jgi:cell fate (sporulation/competence/biofilm development) regulator YmcA (YheA/YmcA/DUF963 family)
MHVIMAQQVRPFDVLHGDRKIATNEETIGALEDRFGDKQLVAQYRNQLKTRNQILSVFVHEFISVIKVFTNRAIPALHEDHFCR